MVSEINPLELLPKDESLKDYIKRIRELKGMTRLKLSKLSAVHVSTIARIENGSTGSEKPRREVQERICKALQIPVEYMQASAKGESVIKPQTNKVCQKCWIPGSSPDIRWSELDAKFCLKCGDALRQECGRCKEPILLRGRFCPGCGEKY
ncbi:MAG: helix-turn-helix domain-containing protein [Pegethrix bostrychoides GSE-TBD4-15B]|jgi:transcriptional regulator with XRE-family HTH domain|uniref:Helix-turn-helix domain-containing protein n=1 Tax=Pegethrix bostrychoides GSE-TBD4-15B TaxID=2839662 RepID=A0A951P8S1_9CYAN|nr:helix-turn-helix domain-containing protein [Pegethrix bostrychoides GSE-TBD4-15B]